ncbi:MAG: ROK family protein [Blautia sp.]|nr:ROK family protein [Blautia sp.]
MMERSGFNNATLKFQNRGLVLRLVTTGECASRIDVSKQTGLSKMAATNIIAGFIEENILEERETIQVKGKGRNPIWLGLSPKAPRIVGVYVGTRDCTVVLADMHLQILARAGFAISQENHSSLTDTMCRYIDRILKKTSGEKIWGISVSTVGAVDIQKGTIKNPLDLYGPEEIPVVQILKEKYNLPVMLETRYNGAALAEKLYGNAKDVENFLFCGICEEVGSGLVIGGTTGSVYGMTGNLGHTSIEVKGRQCKCGRRGCLTMYASTPVIRAKYRKAASEELPFREICRNAEKGEENAAAILDGMTERLASGLINAANLFTPQKILLGFDACCLPAKYISRLETLINEESLSGEPVPVQKSSLGRNAGIKGCASKLLMSVFDGTLL